MFVWVVLGYVWLGSWWLIWVLVWLISSMFWLFWSVKVMCCVVVLVLV